MSKKRSVESGNQIVEILIRRDGMTRRCKKQVHFDIFRQLIFDIIRDKQPHYFSDIF